MATRRLPQLLTAILAIVALRASAQSCPTKAPGGDGEIRYSGTGCASGTNAPCLFGQLVTFSVPPVYTVQACDTVEWDFGDGSGTRTDGIGTWAHMYGRTGQFYLTLTIRNSLGSWIYAVGIGVSNTPGCPLYPPSTVRITYSAQTCATDSANPCRLDDPITFTVAPYFPQYSQLQSCDSATFNFGDGSTVTLPPGTFSTTHTYATPGTYDVSTSVRNDFGTAPAARLFGLPVRNGTVNFQQSYTSTIREGSVGHYRVVRSSGKGAFTVNYATADLSAVAGTHYTAVAGTLSFVDGEDSKTIDIPTIDDTNYNGDRSFALRLSAPTGGYVLVATAGFDVTIIDNDMPTVSFSSATYSTIENAGTTTVTLNRSGDLSKATTVAYEVSNLCCQAAYQAVIPATGQLVFGANETSKTVEVTLFNDDRYYGFRRATIRIAGITGGQAGGSGNATLEVSEDEPVPVISIESASVKEGVAGKITIVPITVSLSGPLAATQFLRTVTSSRSARSGSDYIASSTSFNLPAGTTSFTVNVTVLGDDAVEPDETFAVVMSDTSANINACCSDSSSFTPTSMPVTPGLITIVNDDAAIAPPTQNVARGTVGTILIDLGQGRPQPLTLNVLSSAPGVASVPATITVPPGFARAEIPVTAEDLGDAVITAVLPAAFDGGTLAAAVTVYEGASLVFDTHSLALTAGENRTVRVSAQPPLATPLFVALASLDPSVLEVPASVVIAPGEPATFTVKALKKGETLLKAQLPPQNGAVSLYMPVEVTEAPPAPAILQLLPASGPSAGGTAVNVSGANLTADCTLNFGGAPAVNVAYVNASSLIATTPAHAAGAVDVVLICTGSSSTLQNGFSYVATGASISSVTPSFGSVDGGTYVRISGANFAPGCWPFFGATAARGAAMKSAFEIIATSPPHAAETVDVSVRCGAATDATLMTAFAYTGAAEPSPVITSLDPAVGSAGQSVTIRGARFAASDRVAFDGTAATILAAAPDALTVRIPDLALGKTAVTVTDANGHSSTTGPIFTVLEPIPPQITSAMPSTTRAAGELTLDGNGFRPGYSFAIGDAKAATINMTYKRSVIRVPDVAAGVYRVNVLNAAGQIAAVGPSISVGTTGVVVKSITPGCATSDGNVAVTISGDGFVSGASVTVDGIAAGNVVVVNAQTITATLPAIAPGNPAVAVVNPSGDRGTLTAVLALFSPFDPNVDCAPKRRGVHH